MHGVDLTPLYIWKLGGTRYGSGLMFHVFCIKNPLDQDSQENQILFEQLSEIPKECIQISLQRDEMQTIDFAIDYFVSPLFPTVAMRLIHGPVLRLNLKCQSLGYTLQLVNHLAYKLVV